jgi:putative YhdH/YhfP family quinone oxidoreductase
MNEQVPGSFKAFRIHNDDDGYRAGIESISLEDLSEGDVVIKVHFSGINFKDALAGTGKGKILRRFPLNGGIDAAGTVISSESERFSPGDKVLVTGSGLSETRDGGYSEYLRMDSAWLVPLPGGLSMLEAMTLGTAGFTAAMSLYRMEINGQKPEQGPIVVTGATGGVGSIAIDIFSTAGYEVQAISGKTEQFGWLESLGASQCFSRHDLGRHQPEHDCAAVHHPGCQPVGHRLPDVPLFNPRGNLATPGRRMETAPPGQNMPRAGRPGWNGRNIQPHPVRPVTRPRRGKTVGGRLQQFVVEW